jgi:hypothetical protein
MELFRVPFILRPLFTSAVLVTAAAASPLLSAEAGAQVQTVISTASDGTPGVGLTFSHVAVNASGRFVVFVTNAPNLVPGDDNTSFDVFVKDRQTNATSRVSVASDGTERHGTSGGVDISDDGQIVVFTSTMALTADHKPCLNTCEEIFVHDRTTGQTTRVTATVDGGPPTASSNQPSISGDGRFVSFTSFASNLVPGDTNDALDVFVHDRQTRTTRRVSVTSTGQQSASGLHSGGSDLNHDGSIVVFTSRATLTSVPDPLTCIADYELPCMRAYLHELSTGTTTRISPAIANRPDARVQDEVVVFGPDVDAVKVDASGRWVALMLSFPLPGPFVFSEGSLYLYDRHANKTIEAYTRPGFADYLSFSGDGQVVSAFFPNTYGATEHVRYDRTKGYKSVLGRETKVLSFDGEFGVDTDGYSATLLDYDADNDRMDDAWESTFGLNPEAAADAALDADGDGLTNLEEHEAGTHPKGAAKRYLAEGAANAFFTTQIALFNPGAQPAAVSLRFQGNNGLQSSHVEVVPANQRKTVRLTSTSNIPENDFSTLVESDAPVVVDRTMTWDATGYGSHAETALEGPATTWYLAEGATHGAFSLFYLLQNPNAGDATVTVDYLRLAPLPPVTRTYTVPGRSRLTIPVDAQGPDLAEADLAARITSDVPIIAERAMYATVPGQPAFTAGHGGAGVTSTALKWFLAEGATGSFFDLFVLVANPNAVDAELRVTYLFPTGDPLVKTYTAGANNRLTISVETEDVRLADTPVSIVVESINNQPVVVERAMWWPSPVWHEAHLSAGATATGTKWALAEGEVHSAAGKETYILIANTGATDGAATVTFLREGAISPSTPTSFLPAVQLTVPLPANSRTNVPMMLAPELNGHRFATIVESDGVPIVVERAMYQTINGVVWSSGTSALATKLQ